MCWMGLIFIGQIFRSFCAVYLRSLRSTMLGALNCLHNTTTLHLWYFAHVSCVILFVALVFQTQQHKILVLIENQLGVSLGNAASTNWTLIPGLKLMKRHKLLKGITSLSNHSHKKKQPLVLVSGERPLSADNICGHSSRSTFSSCWSVPFVLKPHR